MQRYTPDELLSKTVMDYHAAGRREATGRTAAARAHAKGEQSALRIVLMDLDVLARSGTADGFVESRSVQEICTDALKGQPGGTLGGYEASVLRDINAMG